VKKKPISILLVEDHNLVRNALARLISIFKFSSVIHHAANGQEAIDFLITNHADLVLLDIQMPVLGGIEVLKRIRELDLSSRVIILTQFDEPSLILYLLECGANGFLQKDCQAGELENAIINVMIEGHYYSDLVPKVLKDGVSKKNDMANLDISPREFQVMALLKDGKSNKEISSRLGLTLRTIESYRKALMKKMNCQNTAELISPA
jgi:two-component system response regulator DegU